MKRSDEDYSGYWIELAKGDPCLAINRGVAARIRADAAGYRERIERQLSLMFKVYVSIGSNAEDSIQRAEAILRGLVPAMELPGELVNFLDEEIPEGSITLSFTEGLLATFYKTGANDVNEKVRMHFDEKDYGETISLIELYLTKLSIIQREWGLNMTAKETLEWLIEHWHLGDEGCAAAFVKRYRPRQNTQSGTTQAPHLGEYTFFREPEQAQCEPSMRMFAL